MTRPQIESFVDVTDRELSELMLLACVEPRHKGWQRSWNRQTRSRVGLYCAKVHLAASDNVVRVPKLPSVLRHQTRYLLGAGERSGGRR